MPEKDFYLLIALSIIAGLWLIQIVAERIGRRRKSRRLERENRRVRAQKGGAKLWRGKAFKAGIVA